MKLTSREKKLLLVLSILLLLWGYYKFILSYQVTTLNAKQQDRRHYESEFKKIETIIYSQNDVDRKITNTSHELEELSKKIFSKTDQSQLILLVNELLEGTNLLIQNISFSPHRMETIEESQLEVVSITLPYEGEYSSLLLFLEKVRNYDRKIIIQNLDIKTNEDKILYGSILLDFYSLSDFVGTENNTPKFLFDSSQVNDEPFQSFEVDYFITDENYEEVDLSGIEIDFNNTRTILESFENIIVDFIPSHLSIQGEVMLSENSKHGQKSLGLYYSFPPIQEKKRININFNKSKIIITNPAESIGLWLYSYDATKESVKITVKNKYGEMLDLTLTVEIDWIGWNHLKVQAPKDDTIYPIQIEGIILDIDSSNHGKGTVLFDSLESYYPLDAIDNRSSIVHGNYQFYDVQIGDTLASISKAFYNDVSKQDIIKTYNGIRNNSDLKPGKTLIIPKL